MEEVLYQPQLVNREVHVGGKLCSRLLSRTSQSSFADVSHTSESEYATNHAVNIDLATAKSLSFRGGGSLPATACP